MWLPDLISGGVLADLQAGMEIDLLMGLEDILFTGLAAGLAFLFELLAYFILKDCSRFF